MVCSISSSSKMTANTQKIDLGSTDRTIWTPFAEIIESKCGINQDQMPGRVSLFQLEIRCMLFVELYLVSGMFSEGKSQGIVQQCICAVRIVHHGVIIERTVKQSYDSSQINHRVVQFSPLPSIWSWWFYSQQSCQFEKLLCMECFCFQKLSLRYHDALNSFPLDTPPDLCKGNGGMNRKSRYVMENCVCRMLRLSFTIYDVNIS